MGCIEIAIKYITLVFFIKTYFCSNVDVKNIVIFNSTANTYFGSTVLLRKDR